MKNIFSKMMLISAFSFSTFTHAQNSEEINYEIASIDDRMRAIELEIMKQRQPIIPTGSVLTFASSNFPKGYFLCDGRELNRIQYARLFEVIGTSHGDGDGSTTFNIPDYRGLFLRGVSYAEINAPVASTRNAMRKGGNTGERVGSIQDTANLSHAHQPGGFWISDINLTVEGTALPKARELTFFTENSGEHVHSLDDAYYSVQQLNKPNNLPGSGNRDFNNSVLTRKINTQSSGKHNHKVVLKLPDYNLKFNRAVANKPFIAGWSANSGIGESRPKNAYVNFIIKY
ncbi:phage tail protein [Fluviispira multicolorata]|nr:phage tail protein [Fluviispira multicolorata]